MNLSILLVTGLPIDNPVLKFLLILLIILFPSVAQQVENSSFAGADNCRSNCGTFWF
jgi:hypothetical protein